MGQPGFQVLCVHLLALLLLLVLWPHSQSVAQQQYDNANGYGCSNSGKTSCNSHVLYRAQMDYDDVASIAKLLDANATRVGELNNLVVNETLRIGQALLVPITCGCYNDSSYGNITYKIVDGDSFYNLTVYNFEYLSSTTSVINANPTVDYNNLFVGQVIVFPVGCACPSLDQIANGVVELVTYTIIQGDSTSQIAASFGVQEADVISANELAGTNAQIDADSTLLIPVNTSQPTYSAPTLPSPTANTPTSPQAPTSSSGASSSSGSSHTAAYVGIAVGSVVGTSLFIAAAALCCFVCLRARRKQLSERKDTETPLVPGERGVTGIPIAPIANDKDKGDPLVSMYDLVGSDRPVLFTYAELCDATDNFSDGSKLHGSVYRGVLKGQVVAIKQMKGNVSQELGILCRVHHSNLVRLVGMCVKEAEHLYLVYEYAENGSLSDCLHTDFMSRNKLSTKSSSYLSWTTRVQVAVDAASGLEYIHDYVNPGYVHKDVKSSNILLDNEFRAKIANFAMAKKGGTDDMMTRHIAGTYGYMAPEYLDHGLVSTKADVFSFGVVLLELLSGAEAISEVSEGGEERCLYLAIRPILESQNPAESLKQWMDPVLGNNYPMDTALSIAALATSCVDMDPISRPGMKDVTFALTKFLRSSLDWEASSAFATTLAETPIEAR